MWLTLLKMIIEMNNLIQIDTHLYPLNYSILQIFQKLLSYQLQQKKNIFNNHT